GGPRVWGAGRGGGIAGGGCPGGGAPRRPRTGPALPRAPRLEWDGEESVDAVAVADDDALAELEAGVLGEQVEVAAGGEEVHATIAHDAHDEEGRLREQGAVLVAQDR